MSDLHRAVQDEIASFAPPAVPPFEELIARRRERDRRRLAAGGAALSAVALAAAVGLAALTGGGDVLAGSGGLAAPGSAPSGQDPRALGSVPAQTFDVRPAARPGTDGPVSTCLTLPGAGVPIVLDGAYRVSVGGDDQIRAFKACVEAVPGHTAEVVDGPATDGSLDGTSDGLVWTGATICGDVDDACRRLEAEQAQQLDAVLDTAVPAPPGIGYCRAAGPTYTVRFEHPTARTVPITVRTVCGPMEQGGEAYLLDEPGQDRVAAIYQAAAAPPEDGGLSSASVTGLDVGDSTRITLAAPCGVPPLLVDGVPYLATRYAAPGDSPPGWETEEQGRLRRIAPDSVIFVADEGGERIQFFAAPGRSLQGCPDQ